MAIKLKKKVELRVKEKKVKVEDILREEILKAFLKLIFAYIIGTILLIILTCIYALTTLLVPLRYGQNLTSFKTLIQKIKLKYKDPQNIKELCRMLG